MRTLLFVLLLATAIVPLHAQQVNDPGVTFDESKFDPDYPQMAHWITAGVRGGIPLIESLNIRRTLNAGANSSAINAAINDVVGLGGGAVLLTSGTYDINDEIQMKSGVYLVGQSREGVRCVINPAMTANSGAFEFKAGVNHSGIYRLTIEGGWGTPQYDWNEGIDANNELPGNENISVFFKDSVDCWIDDCTILNSADFPVRIAADHITVRNCHIDGVFNKHGGAHGYFFILEGYNLVTDCFITHLRHISLQGDGVRYNVVYDNDFAQEISFHSGDDGDNLIENNRVHIPADMPNANPDYYSIMGPWSSQHEISTRPNYVYKNDVIEYNHGGARPWSDPNIVYYGPHYVRPADPYTNFTPYSGGAPHGGTLYPIILGDPVDVDGVSVSPPSGIVMAYETTTLTATVSPTNASNQGVTWSSSDVSVATVDPGGVVTALSAGMTTVAATTLDGGFTDDSLIIVIPSDRTAFHLGAVHDAYLQGGTRYDTEVLRVEAGNRVSYLMFDLGGISGTVSSAELELSVGADPGNGVVTVDKGNANNWTEANLSPANAPTSSGQLGTLSGSYATGATYTWDLNEALIEAGGMLSLIVTHASGNDVSFVSDENSNVARRPVLTITVSNAIDTALYLWMANHGLTDPYQDADGDGFDNWSEYVCGTDPNDTNSLFRVSTVSANGPGCMIAFDTASNRLYAVETTEDLLIPCVDLTNGVPGTGGRIEILDGGGNTNRFYRGRVHMQ